MREILWRFATCLIACPGLGAAAPATKPLNSPPKLSGTQFAHDVDNLKNCFLSEAVQLDDHQSDGATIADGVLSACALEAMKLEADTELLRPISQREQDDMDASNRKWAIQMVLERRAAFRGEIKRAK